MNVIVTGSSRGIGRETAFLLATQKECHVLAISRDGEGLGRLQRECLDALPSARIDLLVYDLERIHADRSFLEDSVLPYFDHLDVLINNAGYLFAAPFEETATEVADRMLDINFKVPATLIRKVMPLLGKKTPGHVVSISSMGGVQGSVKFHGLAYYSASKGALAILTECLAEEYREQDISFNCLAFGAVQTEMLSTAFPGYQAPLSAGDAARFIADFALTGHRYFNGKVLPVSVTTP